MSIMATFSGDVQYTQNGTLTNPWSNCHKLSTSVTMRHKSWGPWSRSNSATLEVLLVDGFPVVGFFRGVHTCNESFHSAVHMEEPEQLSVLSVLSVTCCQTTMPRCVVSHRSASSVAVCGRLWPSVAVCGRLWPSVAVCGLGWCWTRSRCCNQRRGSLVPPCRDNALCDKKMLKFLTGFNL